MSERTEAILERLNRQGNDDHYIEAKSGNGRLDKGFWSSVSAFANTSGGIIVLGVKEDQASHRFTVNEEFDYHRANDQLISGFSTSQTGTPGVSPQPKHNIQADDIDGHPVIIIEILPMRESDDLARHMPCYVTSQGLEKGSYKRVLDGDVRMSSYEIFQLSTLREPDRSDSEAVSQASMEDIDRAACDNLLSSFVQSGSRVLYGTRSDEEAYHRLNIVTKEGTEYVPTLAGLLTFGVYPQQFFPQLFIDVAVHPKAKKSTDSVRFLDRKLCDGPLPVAIESAIAAVMGTLRTRSVESGSKIIDEPEIPEIAIREAIVNAVMHRDYHSQVWGRQVQVDVYPDRVEINNPGGLWGDRTVENMDDGRSVSRNPILARLLSQVTTQNGSQRVAENQGSGIQRMRAGMREYGLPQPEFRPRIGEFTVVLYRFGILDPKVSSWVENVAPHLPHQAQIALVIARDLGGVTVKQLRDHCGVDSDDARDILHDLVDRGLIEDGVETDCFHLVAGYSTGRDKDDAVVATLEHAAPLSAKEISAQTGIKLNTLRPILRRLIESELIVATAPATSRNRKYVLA
ncbi:ATP-binding protein [Corynebacterium pyruviciproducens]